MGNGDGGKGNGGENGYREWGDNLMGARMMEAVIFQSGLEDAHLLRLLGVLAAGAEDSTGLVDPAPTRETLATLSDCTPRTITNRIDRLVTAGVVEQVRIGSGPGNPSAYRVLITPPETTHLNGKGEKGETKGESVALRMDRLEAEMGEIKALFFTLIEKMGETKGEKGETAAAGKGEKGESALSGSEHPILREEELREDKTTTAAPVSEGKGESDEEAEYQTAVKASLELLDYWQDLTGSFAPKNDEDKRKNDYIGPLNRLWIRCGRDIDQAKTLLKENRQQMLDGGKTPFRPAAIVPAIIAKLDGARPGGASARYSTPPTRPAAPSQGLVAIEEGRY